MINASQTLLGGILENNRSYIFTVDKNLHYLWFNRRYASAILSSYEVKVLIGMKLPDCIELNHQYSMEDALCKALNGESFNLIRRPKETDQKKAILEFYFYPLYQNETLVGAACQITDITKRVNYDRQKFENLKSLFEKRLNGFTKIIPDFVLISNQEGVRKFANKSYCDFFQTTIDKLVGNSYFDKIPDTEREEYRKNLNSVSKDNPSITHIHKLTNPKGEEKWVLWTETAVFDTSGRFIELLSIGRDVDDMVKAKQMREKYIDVLEKTIFKTSHEVRQPVSNILGLAQIMEKENYSPNEMAFIVDYFKESADKLDAFTKELTNFIHESIDTNKARL